MRGTNWGFISTWFLWKLISNNTELLPSNARYSRMVNDNVRMLNPMTLVEREVKTFILFPSNTLLNAHYNQCSHHTSVTVCIVLRSVCCFFTVCGVVFLTLLSCCRGFSIVSLPLAQLVSALLLSVTMLPSLLCHPFHTATLKSMGVSIWSWIGGYLLAFCGIHHHPSSPLRLNFLFLLQYVLSLHTDMSLLLCFCQWWC